MVPVGEYPEVVVVVVVVEVIVPVGTFESSRPRIILLALARSLRPRKRLRWKPSVVVAVVQAITSVIETAETRASLSRPAPGSRGARFEVCQVNRSSRDSTSSP